MQEQDTLAMPSPGIYTQDQLPYLANIQQLVPGIVAEFRQRHPDWDDGLHLSVRDLRGGVDFKLESTPGLPVKTWPNAMVRYPQSRLLMQLLGDDASYIGYKVMEPGERGPRRVFRTGVNGDYVRVCVPLIVPQGDCYMEVCGEEQALSTALAYNAHYLHSSYNLTTEPALLLHLEVKRSLLGLDPAPSAYSVEVQAYLSQVKPYEGR
jgi:hypothetical protein